MSVNVSSISIKDELFGAVINHRHAMLLVYRDGKLADVRYCEVVEAVNAYSAEHPVPDVSGALR